MTTTYLSIDNAPLDDYVTPDVGDAHPVNSRLFAQAHVPQPPNPNFILPYTRTIKLDTIGLDVVGAKRAIWRHNGLPIPKRATKRFGPVAVFQLKAAQQKLGVKEDGELGPETLKVLSPWFDDLAFFDYVGYAPGGNKEDQERSAICAYAVWGYNNRGQIAYAQYRPMNNMGDLYHLPEDEDCSTFCTKGYKEGKAQDPNGLHYNGNGNTVTMRAHGRVVSLGAAKPGDLAHYDNPQHVGFYVGNNRVIALGSDPGPLLLPVDYRPLTYIRSYL